MSQSSVGSWGSGALPGCHPRVQGASAISGLSWGGICFQTHSMVGRMSFLMAAGVRATVFLSVAMLASPAWQLAVSECAGWVTVGGRQRVCWQSRSPSPLQPDHGNGSPSLWLCSTDQKQVPGPMHLQREELHTGVRTRKCVGVVVTEILSDLRRITQVARGRARVRT